MTSPAALQDARFLVVDLLGMLQRRRRSLLWWLGLGMDALQQEEVALSARLVQLSRTLSGAPDEVARPYTELEGCVCAVLSGESALDSSILQRRALLAGGPPMAGVRAWFRHGAHHADAVRAALRLDATLEHLLEDVPVGDASLFARDDGTGRTDRVKTRRLSGTRVTAAG